MKNFIHNHSTALSSILTGIVLIFTGNHLNSNDLSNIGYTTLSVGLGSIGIRISITPKQ